MLDSHHLPTVAILVAQQTTPQIASSLMWLGAIVAGVRRKQVIGGWLFFFFWQVVAGIAVTIVSADWSRYAPRAWKDQFKYFAFMLVTMPRIAILAAVAAIGVMLIRTYEWRWVIVMRYALIIYSVLGIVSVAADFIFFPERVSVDTATLIFPIAYTIYFYVSSRVRSVFLDRVWDQRAVRVAS
jgi:hypothetical protein